MQRREFLKLGAATGMSLALSRLGRVAQSSEGTQRPNILWISCEDISPRLGCYGDRVAKTPNLDRLAAEGMRFDRVFTSSPVCAPVRSGIITGMYPTTIGTAHMRTGHRGQTGELPTPYEACPPPYVKGFPEYLRAAGYYCTNNVKTDYQFGNPRTIWDECSNRAHYRNRPDKDQPFFAVFNSTVTHESQTWQDPEMTDPNAVSVPPYYPDTPPVRRSIARLYDQIAKMDTWVGGLLKELEDEGLDDNTIVFFWGDHGDGLPRGKRWPYDSGTHIPLIVRWPGHIRPGRVCGDLINSIDFGPTVLSISGVRVPAHVQGRAFLGDQKAEPRSYVFSHRDRFDESYDMIRSVRDAKYRYVRNYFPNRPYVLWIPYRNRSPIMQEMLRLHAEDKLEGPQKLWFSGLRPPEELYDCQVDPHHICNLADDPQYGPVLRRFREVLDEWRLQTGDLGDVAESELVRRWWPDGKQPQTARPHFVPNAPSNRGQNLIDSEAVTLEGPALVDLYCATQGASLAYTHDEGNHAHWRLFTAPIRLPKGKTLIRARAIRYGYKESEETRCVFAVA